MEEKNEFKQILQGTLDIIPFTDLMNLISVIKKTGILILETEELKAKFYFNSGELTFIETKTLNKIVADHLLKEGLINDDIWAEMISTTELKYGFSGFNIFHKGYIDALSLANSIRFAIVEIMAKFIGKDKGRFIFEKVDQPFYFPITLSLSVPYLLLNAARVADEKNYYSKEKSLLIKSGINKGKLVFIVKEKIVLTHTLKTGTTIIGSGDKADIQLKFLPLAPLQLRITSTGENFFIDNLEPRNEVLINNEVISRIKLKDGDEIKVGELRILFYVFKKD